MALTTSRLVLFALTCAGVFSQEYPWPPLITTCDVMPLIAKDLDTKPNLLSCSSTAWPMCETINCEVTSNSDQLELELLPCWQKPAMWIKNRDIHGKMLYQNIFAAPGLVSANIGGNMWVMNVTVVQRKITLGFGVDISIPGVINQTTTIIPYRDIPLNLSECDGNDPPDYPLNCKLLLYMEQYIMTAYSALSHDPARVPSCSQPDTKACNSITCSWKNRYQTPITHIYEYMPCAKPQGFRLILEAGLWVYNMTYDESTVYKINETMKLNVTVKHPTDQTLGFQVDVIDYFEGTYTEIPYHEVPLSTSGCSKKHASQVPSFIHSKKTLYKHKPQLQVPTFLKSAATAFESESDSESTLKVRPLTTTCDVLPELVGSLNSVLTSPFVCTPSQPPCNSVFCSDISNDDFIDFELLPCRNPPAIQILRLDMNTLILTSNVTISRSGLVSFNFTNATVLANFTIVHHSLYLTMGVNVNATIPKVGNAMVLPYIEIPINRSSCPGVKTPLPMCAAMQNLAQYLNVYLANITRDINQPWDCSLSTTCTNITCTNGNMSAGVVLEPCSKTVTLYMPPGSPNSTQERVVRITRSGSTQLDDTDTLISQLYYNPSTQTLGLQVSIVYQDIQNESLSMSVAVIPYTSIPLNLTTCKTDRDNATLITTCDVMAKIASAATDAMQDQITCSSSPPPCNSANCNVVSNNDSLVFSVLPCANTPAISIINRAQNGTVKFSEIFNMSDPAVEATIGDDSVVMNITIIQHPQMLTLGVGIWATIHVNDTLVPVEFVPYVEIPLNRTQCSRPKTQTCKVMSQVAQYLGFFMSNRTHKPFQCQVVEEALCNNISCSGHSHPHGYVNMSFLPCGEHIGFNIYNGNKTDLFYNFTVFDSTMINFTTGSSGDVTLEQQPGKKAVTFQLDLYLHENSTTTFIGSEVPRVTIPLNASMCNATTPPGNHTHNNTATLIDTCEVMPLLARATTQALGDTVTCVSSTQPNCNTVSCRDRSNNVTLSYAVLTCRSPPAIQILNRNAQGNVTFNMTFVNTSKSVSANILGWGHLASLNVTLVQHHSMLTLGLAIDVMGGSNVDPMSLVPYFEIPINGPECNVCLAPIYPPGFLPTCAVVTRRWTFNATSGECEEITFHPCGQQERGFNVFMNSTMCERACITANMDTPTCRTMDNVAQYMTVFLGNLTHSPDHTPSCCAVRPYCNSFLCTLPNGAGFYNNSFLPCDNPIGFSSVVVDHLSNISRNVTQYQSGTYFTSETTSVDITLDQLGPSLVGFELIFNTNETGKVMSLQEIPYVRIPLNTSVCNTGPGPQPNTSHTSNNSLISTCEVLPLVAQQASNALPGSITCTSSKMPNCNSISCIVLDTREMLRFTFLPCATSPAVRFTVSNRTFTSTNKSLTGSATVMASIGGEDMPLYFNIKQLNSTLSLGLEVSALTGDGNVTFVKYVEIPLDRSACPQTTFYGSVDTCMALYNISQYMNYIISSITGETADCIPMAKCSEMTCNVGQNYSSLTLTILTCDIPQCVRAVVAEPDGVVTTIVRFDDIQTLYWNVGSKTLIVDVTLQHPSDSDLGIQATVDYRNSSGPVTLVPPVDIPLNLTGCENITPPTYTNYSLINACNIMPVIARLTFPPAGVASIMCSSSAPPNCSTITCSAAGSRETVVFRVEPCYNPPAITVEKYVGDTRVFHQTSSHQIIFNFASTQPMRATLIQHTQKLSIGFKVDLVSVDFVASFIPYREIPLDYYGCTGAVVSPTCKVMNNIAQYMTVFLANYTTNVNSTPDCYADRRSLCNNITCVMPGSGDRYNYSFNSCEDPISFNIRHTFSDYTVVSEAAYTGSQDLQVMNLNSSRLTFNHIDAKTVQIQISSDAGDFIPLVTVPLDVELCKYRPTPTSSTTRQPNVSPSSKLALYIVIPVAAVAVIVVLIIVIILVYTFMCRRKMSDEPYSYRPLMSHHDTEDDEEEEGEGRGGDQDAERGDHGGQREPADLLIHDQAGDDDAEEGEGKQ